MKHAAMGLVMAMLAGTADAAVINWSASLAPENEVPPVTTSSGSGSASGTVDTDTGLLTWLVDWTDLTGDAIGAHFHAPATTTENAAVVVNIGLISGLTPAVSGSTTISAPQVAGLRAGLWYINVHTAANTGGEVRGQVVPAPIPVPATLPLLIGAGAVLGFLGRRRA